jgi:catechol 2,3-dioxygenase-like lactoylglutathione lyase family enzyme
MSSHRGISGLSGRVHALIPYAHVADVERSLAFYALLGLERRMTSTGPGGRTVWAEAACGQTRLMLAQSSGVVPAEDQAVLFYLHCDDARGLREHLLRSGLYDGGRFTGQPGPNGGREVVFDMTTPHYMPGGEIRVHDPDGYVLLIGQLAARA